MRNFYQVMCTLLLAVFILMQMPALAQKTTASTTSLPSGRTETTTTAQETYHSSDGSKTTVTTVETEIKDKDGNTIKLKKNRISKTTKRGKPVVSSDTRTTSTFDAIGDVTTITDSETSWPNGDTTDKHSEDTSDVMTGEFIYGGVKTRQLRAIKPQSGTGTSNETSYAPDIAGPGSTIVATFTDPAHPSGPSGQALVAFEDSKGHRTFFRTLSDAQHHVTFKVAEGAVAVWLFKSFTRDGKPDSAVVKTVISRAADVEGTEPIESIAAHGPAITRAATAYERGGMSKGLISVQTRSNDPTTSRLLVDGSYLPADTVAASDRNVKALLRSTTALGRHRISLVSRNDDLMPPTVTHSNSVPVDIVALRADPVAPSETGTVETLTVHVAGLPSRDSASMYFSVSGSARLENGGETAQVPVVNGIAQVRIRGEHSGPALIKFHLIARLADATGAAGFLRTVVRGRLARL